VRWHTGIRVPKFISGRARGQTPRRHRDAHANDTEGMLERLCDLIEERIFPAPRRSVGATVDLCVHLTLDRAALTGRRLSGLDAVKSYDPVAQRWLLEPIA
jgi:hypothetical protein